MKTPAAFVVSACACACFAVSSAAPNAVKIGDGEGRIGRENVHDYQDEETDPLRFSGTENVLLVLRGRPQWSRFAASWYCRTVRIEYPKWSRGQVFRVALAPDILAERKAKGASQ